MKKRTLGANGPEVSAIGLGCMGMSAFYGAADEDEAVRTIHRALDLGCNFLDTSDMYGPHTNERARRARDRRTARRGLPGDQVRHQADLGDDDRRRVIDGAAGLRARSLRGLAGAGSASITSTSTTSTASTRARRSRRRSARWPSSCSEGKVRYLGLSEASARRSAAPTPCTRSPRCRPSTRCGRATSRPRSCRRCSELGIALVAYSPLGRGFLSGRFSSPEELDEDDFRRYGPRFTGENLAGQPAARRAGARAGRARRA